MLKRKTKIINVRIDADTYDKLSSMQTDAYPSVSAIVRDLIRIAISSARAQNVEKVTIKNSLEIPVIQTPEESPVIESATFGHRLERKVQPNWGLVMRAYRAKNLGREYDESLEPFFKDLFSGKHS